MFKIKYSDDSFLMKKSIAKSYKLWSFIAVALISFALISSNSLFFGLLSTAYAKGRGKDGDKGRGKDGDKGRGKDKDGKDNTGSSTEEQQQEGSTPKSDDGQGPPPSKVTKEQQGYQYMA
jgi:hypothetical protein